MIKTTLRVALITLLATASSPEAQAQQRIAYVDTEFILERIPEYQTVQQQLDRMAQDWEQDLTERQREVEADFRAYQARELLYTAEERQRRRDEIMQAEDEVERLRMKYFGPEGDLFVQQEQLMRPIQDRILTAIENVATEDGYDYVFDKSGDFLFLFTRAQYDLSNRVLEELGIDVDQIQGR
ncbi:MAG: OmpH family outer membrane protein [Rhodothermales bacterium]|nr:OmpH family outer membrane protein [Rhodothermales bacterium]MBO6779806.1 OmpH family outer membrane protein [Rhodothermales bacterium]